MPSGKFWETMNLLIGKEYRRTGKEVMEDVEDWVEKIIVKREFSVGEPEVEMPAPVRGKKLHVSSSGYFSESKERDKEIDEFIKSVDLPKIACNFSHPHVTSRLEKLMGSNLVCLTDRDYMQKLQERILEDYAESMDKRIKIREHEEMERVKNLVLSGRIPLHEAPESMADHPIMMIEKICKRLIAQRRAKINIPKIHIPTHLYSDDTPDPPSGLSIENGHVFRKPFEKLCNPISRFLPPDEDFVYEEEEEQQAEEEEETREDASEVKLERIQTEVEAEGELEEEEEEEEVDEFMFSRKEYNRLKYESPLIKQLRKCQTVEELYTLADQIIGILQTLEDSPGRALGEDSSFIDGDSTRPSIPSEKFRPGSVSSSQRGSVSDSQKGSIAGSRKSSIP